MEYAGAETPKTPDAIWLDERQTELVDRLGETAIELAELIDTNDPERFRVQREKFILEARITFLHELGFLLDDQSSPTEQVTSLNSLLGSLTTELTAQAEMLDTFQAASQSNPRAYYFASNKMYITEAKREDAMALLNILQKQ